MVWVVSWYLVTKKYTADLAKFSSILPHPNVSVIIKLSLSSVSLLCWAIWNFITALPVLQVKDLSIEIKKHSSKTC